MLVTLSSEDILRVFLLVRKSNVKMEIIQTSLKLEGILAHALVVTDTGRIFMQRRNSTEVCEIFFNEKSSLLNLLPSRKDALNLASKEAEKISASIFQKIGRVLKNSTLGGSTRILQSSLVYDETRNLLFQVIEYEKQRAFVSRSLRQKIVIYDLGRSEQEFVRRVTIRIPELRYLASNILAARETDAMRLSDDLLLSLIPLRRTESLSCDVLLVTRMGYRIYLELGRRRGAKPPVPSNESRKFTFFDPSGDTISGFLVKYVQEPLFDPIRVARLFDQMSAELTNTPNRVLNPPKLSVVHRAGFQLVGLYSVLTSGSDARDTWFGLNLEPPSRPNRKGLEAVSLFPMVPNAFLPRLFTLSESSGVVEGRLPPGEFRRRLPWNPDSGLRKFGNENFFVRQIHLPSRRIAAISGRKVSELRVLRPSEIFFARLMGVWHMGLKPWNLREPYSNLAGISEQAMEIGPHHFAALLFQIAYDRQKEETYWISFFHFLRPAQHLNRLPDNERKEYFNFLQRIGHKSYFGCQDNPSDNQCFPLSMNSPDIQELTNGLAGALKTFGLLKPTYEAEADWLIYSGATRPAPRVSILEWGAKIFLGRLLTPIWDQQLLQVSEGLVELNYSSTELKLLENSLEIFADTLRALDKVDSTAPEH